MTCSADPQGKALGARLCYVQRQLVLIPNGYFQGKMPLKQCKFSANLGLKETFKEVFEGQEDPAQHWAQEPLHTGELARQTERDIWCY